MMSLLLLLLFPIADLKKGDVGVGKGLSFKGRVIANEEIDLERLPRRQSVLVVGTTGNLHILVGFTVKRHRLLSGRSSEEDCCSELAGRRLPFPGKDVTHKDHT